MPAPSSARWIAASVAYVAREAAIRLELVMDELRGLFGACVAEF